MPTVPCWVSPIPTHKDETSLCYVCRNTQVLKQTNNQLELSMFRDKLESIETVSGTLNSMDLDKFSKQISTLEELDMHVQHILLNQDSLEQSQKTMRNIDKNVDSMSSSMSAALIEQSEKIDDLESQIQNFTAVTHQIPQSILTMMVNSLLLLLVSLMIYITLNQNLRNKSLKCSNR